MQIPSSRGITFTGLGSGLDTNSIVRQLVRLETAPVQRMQSMQNSLSQQRSSYQQFRNQLSALSQAAGGLTRQGAFQLSQATSSQVNVASILSSGTASGNYDLSVQRLATAHSVASRRFESADSDLGLRGMFTLNGREIEVQEDDTARTLATKINETESGVRATVVENADGSANLRLTSLQTGAAGRIQFGEMQGGLALGFSDPVFGVNPTPPANNPSPSNLRADQVVLSSTERTQLNGTILRTTAFDSTLTRVTANGGNASQATGAQFASALQGFITDNANSLINTGRNLIGNLLGTTNGDRLVAGVLGASEVAGFRTFASSRDLVIADASNQELAFHLTEYAMTRAAAAGGRSWVDWSSSTSRETAFDNLQLSGTFSGSATTELTSRVLDSDVNAALEYFMVVADRDLSGAGVARVAADLQRFFGEHARRAPLTGSFTRDASIGLSDQRAQLVARSFSDTSYNRFASWSSTNNLNYGTMSDDQFAGVMAAFAVAEVSRGSSFGSLRQPASALLTQARNWSPTPVQEPTPPANGVENWQVIQEGAPAERRLLQSLGFADGATSRAPDGLVSHALFDPSMSMGKVLGVDEDQTLSLTLEGQTISFSARTTSLTQFTEQVSRLTGVSARLLSEDGRYQLQIAANDGSLSFSDPQDIFGKLGMMGRASTLTEGQDAQFTVNGTAMTSSSNTVTNAVQGATLNLNSAGVGATTRLTFSRSADSAVDLIKGLAAAFNAVEGFVRAQSNFDQKTFSAGQLFADGVARQAGDRLMEALYGQSSGGTFRNITQIGFSRGANGELNLNESALRSALESGADGFSRLFGVSGTATGTGLRFVSGGDRTRETGQGSYDVEITQLATQSQVRAARGQTSVSSQEENLTFSGGAFASSPVTVTLASGSSLSDTVNAINNDSRLQGKVSASVENGRLVLTSAQFGSGSAFDVVSDRAASTSNSGIGTAGQSNRTTGRDIAGRINGEAATGMGQLLMGNAGNARTEGLQLEYTGTSTGRVGAVQVEKGVAARLSEALDSILNPTTGLISAFDKSIETKIESLADEIAEVQQRAAQKELALRARFQAMEEMMSRSQVQMSKMQAFMDNQRTMGAGLNPINTFGGSSAA